MEQKSWTAMRCLLALALAVTSASPIAARAQGGAPPSYASREEVIRGTISGFDGSRTVLVRDDRGFVDNVTLRDGTIINPTGLHLATGQSVTIRGFAQGNTFVANEVDTPYSIEPSYAYAPYPPPAAYYGPYVAYPYPYGYAYPYPYYGTAVRIGVVFGPGWYGRGWYGGGGWYGRGYYGRGSYGRWYGGTRRR